MDTQAAFAFEDLFRFALSDLANAISERQDETEVQQYDRCQAAVHMIMGFLPRDVIEVMLAGHCVMLHEAMKAEVRNSLSGEAATHRRTLVALNKAFNDDLDRLVRYRQRPAEGSLDAPQTPPAASVPTPPVADVSVPPVATAPVGPAARSVAPTQPVATPAAPEMNRAARRQAARAEMRAAAAAARVASRQTAQLLPGSIRDSLPQAACRPNGPLPNGPRIDQPTNEAVAKCCANPEAMTALAAGDPVRFAHALGIATPGEAFLAAAKTPGSPFDPLASGPWPPGQRPGVLRAG